MGPIRGYVFWSIFVRTSNKRKLLDTHLPPIVKALDGVEFDWNISTEEGHPGLFRLVTMQNVSGETVDEVIVTVLRRAYRLADGWRISGLDDLATGQLRHVMGGWDCKKPRHDPPSLDSLMFEIEPGRVLGRGREWGFEVELGPQPDKLKPGQIRQPKPPVED